jgi:ubiquinone/menaquinone biosynthesis C-methylase UbiE
VDYQNLQIAAIDDMANPMAEDAAFYLSLAVPPSRSVLDLVCGTGTLFCALARRGHRVIGVDPAAAMLALARSKPHS